MTIEYFLFIHGVNTREVREEPEYAKDLIEKIKERLPDRQETLQFLPLYWGDVNKEKEELMPDLLGSDRYLEIQDLLTNETGLFDFLKEPLSQTTLALLQGGDAHGSYWRSEKVVKEISSVLL